MADVTKVLGQVAPNATTETLAYTVPSLTSTVISSFIVCNRGGSTTTFRLSVSVGGAATTNKDYLYYDVEVANGDSFAGTLGLTLAATDVIRVYAGNSSLSFNLFGVERS